MLPRGTFVAHDAHRNAVHIDVCEVGVELCGAADGLVDAVACGALDYDTDAQACFVAPDSPHAAAGRAQLHSVGIDDEPYAAVETFYHLGRGVGAVARGKLELYCLACSVGGIRGIGSAVADEGEDIAQGDAAARRDKEGVAGEARAGGESEVVASLHAAGNLTVVVRSPLLGVAVGVASAGGREVHLAFGCGLKVHSGVEHLYFMRGFRSAAGYLYGDASCRQIGGVSEREAEILQSALPVLREAHALRDAAFQYAAVEAEYTR